MLRVAGLLAVAASLCEARATHVPVSRSCAAHRAAAPGGDCEMFVNRRSVERCRGLLGLRPNDDGGHIRGIDRGVEEFRAGQL